MKRKLFSGYLSLLLLAFQPLPTTAAAKTWQIDSSKSRVEFLVKNLGLSVKGKFAKVSGEVNYDPEALSNSSIKAVIETSSIDTGNSARDHHLQSKDFFSVTKFPEIIFDSKKIKPGKTNFTVEGTLSMHGIVKPVILTVSPVPSQPTIGADGAKHLTVSASSELKRKDFGIGGFAAATIGNEVTVNLLIDMLER